MKVLIIDDGGRGHTIAWKVAKSPEVEKICCAPGNVEIAEYAECVGIGVMEFEKLTLFAVEQRTSLVIASPDDPLAAGAVDAFEVAGLRISGPRKNAVILEVSEVFSKDLMKKYDTPIVGYETFGSPEEVLVYLKIAKMPIVLETGGLALDGGVLTCSMLEEAKDGVRALMLDKRFRAAGSRIVVEELTMRWEVSVLSFVDGNTVKIITSARDHKQAEDGDQGLNTGGMGTFSPSPFYTDEVDVFCQKHIYQVTVDATKAEGREFKGTILFDLMLTKSDPKVLEYDTRFRDLETQVVLPRVKSDIVDILEACIDGALDKAELEFEDNVTVCVVLASADYPRYYKKGFKIHGLDTSHDKDGYYAFHTDSRFDADGDIVTNNGRVLGVTTIGATLEEARANAYKAMEWIAFDSKYMRGDIGKATDEV